MGIMQPWEILIPSLQKSAYIWDYYRFCGYTQASETGWANMG